MTVLIGLKVNKDNSPRTKESGYLFPTKKGTKRPYIYDLRTPFGKACDVAGIQGLRVHDLRHSFATLAIQGGASLYDVSKLLGHSDISMTQRYSHVTEDNLQKATDNMAGVIDRAINE
jgi:site-specific recombinase XerD